MTEKRTLIVAKTPTEASDHASAHALKDWQFVSTAQDLVGADPAAHELAFVGEWYQRADLKELRQQIRGRGFNTPQLTQIPRIRVRFLPPGIVRNDADDDA
jgi:hypothetical protein